MHTHTHTHTHIPYTNPSQIGNLALRQVVSLQFKHIAIVLRDVEGVRIVAGLNDDLSEGRAQALSGSVGDKTAQ